LTSDGTIWHLIQNVGSDYSSRLKISPRAFATSPLHEYIAVGSNDGEVFIIDSFHRIITRRLGGGTIQSLTFDGVDALLAGTLEGRIFRFELTKQNFEKGD
jgi:hypothetical protein